MRGYLGGTTATEDDLEPLSRKLSAYLGVCKKGQVAAERERRGCGVWFEDAVWALDSRTGSRI